MYKEINKNKSSKSENESLSTSLQAIDSILCMDDTILNSIEKDNFTHEWSMLDMFEVDQKCEKSPPTVNSKGDLQTKIEEKDAVHTTCNVQNEKNNIWQNETFLNEAFTQFVPSQFEMCTKETGLMQCLDSMHLSRNKQQNVNSLKRSVVDYNNDIPNKIYHSEDKKASELYTRTYSIASTKHCTFYGLPDRVKNIFLRIRGIEKLYEWQDECLNLDAVKNRRNLIYALPTSGGKTLVAEILMLKELICNKKNAMFILPFIAIVQEKVQSMAPFALELGFLIEEYAALKGTYPPRKHRKKNSIYMCTIEKALGLINSLIEENRFNEIGIIVVDELHLLGEAGGRGATLEGLLTKALYVNDNVHIVGMSATIGNLDEISEFLNADLYTGNFRPIEVKEYVKCDDNIWLLDLKTEDLLTDLKKINYRYSNDAAIIDPDRIGGLVMDVVPGDSCLIFCSSRKNCENVALLLTKVLFTSLENYKKDEKQKLLNALETEEGLCPILRKTIKFGVAYHHSGLTSEERQLLEDAFKAGTLCVICCTSTLAAGVNLPARRVILRSPYVGNQFLSLNKYKQMVGRAGRAGMGSIGESILICKSNELPKVKQILTSKMDDCLSTLHMDKDRGINNLILSATLFSIATNRSELHKITRRTLLHIQQKRLDINIKQITDEAITEFLKSGVMKVKKKEKKINEFEPNVTVAIPSQNVCFNDKGTQIKGKKKIALTKETELELCNLGRAAMKGNIDIQCAHTLYQDLKKAQEHLILLDYLHLLYIVTPYGIISQIKPVGSVYYNVVINLSEAQMKTARLLGINEITVGKLRDGLTPKNVESRVIQRFYVTLILHELWAHHAVYTIADKFQVNRGVIQNLLSSVSSFAFSVVRFCQELDEFWAFRDLLNTFSKRLSYCCPLELEALMELPLVKIGRARQLYNAGYKTVQCIAKARPMDLQKSIPYLNAKTATKMIEVATLLIVEKVENLKDEAEDVLDGIDTLRGLSSLIL
ncbi:helicase POLQ-like isoform X1 [Hylaeus anthracinus]|uniref:helicase POLQ-like isoform X1 n=1 Tax=Hylaeus anthracinus TaxID=313031 RepID=UPI0023B8F22D|nr:helicase POLQ-like isoform X1 [Hylaeus anthracinus]